MTSSDKGAARGLPLSLEPIGPGKNQYVYTEEPFRWWQAAALDVSTLAKAYAHETMHRREIRTVRLSPGLKTSQYVVISPVRDEADRIEFFAKYYRDMGFEHFIFIDNESSDATLDRILEMPDATVFRATGNFRDARFGMDWINHVLRRYCVEKWIINVDVDEYFAVDGPSSIGEICGALDRAGVRSLHAIMIDLYSEHPARDNLVPRRGDPRDVCRYYDPTGYRFESYRPQRNVWIKGGVRGRVFFPGDISASPALNKTPLVHWRRNYFFIQCAHQLWPRHLNSLGRPRYGALLHMKFTQTSAGKMADPAMASRHTEEYEAYEQALDTVLLDSSSHLLAATGDLTADGLIDAFPSDSHDG